MATRKPATKPKSSQMTEVGYSGLRMFDGVTAEETMRELNFPRSNKVFKEMSYHPAINTALSLYNSMIGKATFRFIPPKDATAREIKQVEMVESMFIDMDRPIEEVMIDIMTMATYGFCVLEKVYKIRKKSKGSLYDDGIVGIKKLAYRSQESIDKFEFDDDGNNIVAVKQNLSLIADPYLRYSRRPHMEIILPREKFLLFNMGRNTSNPYGQSPLRDVYVPWKYLTSIEELEAMGVAKDLQGLPVLYLPAQYMSEDASPEQKAIFDQFKNVIRNLQQNSQSGVILPSAVDPDTRAQLFKLELLSTEGGKKSYDTTKVKDYYRAMIFIGMNADILLMGNTETGSFALGSLKSSLTGSFVESVLQRIVRVFNDDLIKQVYELNGWDVSRRCKMDYEGFEDTNLDEFSKAVQRIGAVGYLPKTIEVVNKVLSAMSIDTLPDDTDVKSILPEKDTKAGEGMKEGMGSGTGSSNGSSGDQTSSNNDN
jgi:hypothetical protein